MKSRPIVLVVGTRPEAIKMAPVYWCLERSPALRPVLVSSGQHRELLESALEPLGLEPDHRLDVMQPDQTPSSVASAVLDRLPPLLDELAPAALLVQGDTTTVLAAALAAYHLRLPVGHVESGLRTYDHDNPFPEEANRQLVDRIARWCFAPTEQAKLNLLEEKISQDRVFVTGNTSIDTLLAVLTRSEREERPPYVLVTLHRRESLNGALREILSGLLDFLGENARARAVWPVHPNPGVTRVASELLGRHDRAELLPPADYRTFVELLAGARVVLTDSGGVQEEAPSLGIPVLVARDTTERSEAIDAGAAQLVGRSRGAIHRALAAAWSSPPWDGPIPAPSPFGDGHAAERIVEVLAADLGTS